LDPIHILHFNHLQLYLLSFGILWNTMHSPHK
jgi:hypothetical protein